MEIEQIRLELDSLNEELTHKFWAANSYLTLSKPTAENLLYYKNLIHGITRFQFLLSLIKLPLDLITKFLKALILSVLTPWEWLSFKSTSFIEREWLLISNTDNLNGSSHEDRVMGLFENLLSHKTSRYYMNARATRLHQTRLIKNRRKDNEIIIGAKTLNPISTLLILYRTLPALYEILAILFKSRSRTLAQKSIIIEALKSQLSRKTLTNISLANQVSHILSKSQIKYIIFSFEGNSHERMLVKAMQDKHTDKTFFLYQHAPILPTQYGINNVMKILQSNMVILTSGETTKNFFIQIPDIIEKKIEVITAGSLKYIPQAKSFNLCKSPDRKSILFLPEANHDSFFESVDTMQKLSADMKNVQFVIRKHPALRISKKSLSKLIGDLHFNESLSNLDLTEDFERSSICIFRSSAAAIEGISFGVMPFHMNFTNNLDLNPLSEEVTGFKVPQAHCFDELRSHITNYLETGSIGNESHYAINPSASELYFGNSLRSEFADWIK